MTHTMMPDEHDMALPPQDLAAEQSVLGAMLLSRDAIEEVTEIVVAADFYRHEHRTVFAAITCMYDRGDPVDMVTASAELDQVGELHRIGGGAYLHTLIAMVPTAANAAYYADLVRDRAGRRRLVEGGTRIAQLGYRGSDGDSVAELIDRAQMTFEQISAAGERAGTDDVESAGDLVQGLMDWADEVANNGGPVKGVPTGFIDFDQVTMGLHQDQLVIVGGRPGTGKTTWGLDVCRSAAIKHHEPAVIFSLEMSKLEVMQRIACAEARIRLADMRAGRMSDADWARLARAMARIKDAPLYIDDSPNLTLMQIRAKARRLARTHGTKLIFVDYLQLMESGAREESRRDEVGRISRGLKLLAKELSVPVMAASQLNRESMNRQGNHPQLSDLRESGTLEQDSDLVILVHRPDAFDRDDRPGEADLILAKHRAGPQATINVAHQLHYCRFVDMTQE